MVLLSWYSWFFNLTWLKSTYLQFKIAHEQLWESLCLFLKLHKPGFHHLHCLQQALLSSHNSLPSFEHSIASQAQSFKSFRSPPQSNMVCHSNTLLLVPISLMFISFCWLVRNLDKSVELPASDWPVGRTVGSFSWLVIDFGEPNPLGQCHSWEGSSGLYKKADWISYGEQTIMQYSFLVSYCL